MKPFRLFINFVLTGAVFISSCGSFSEINAESPSIHIDDVVFDIGNQNINNGAPIIGADVSSVLSLEKSGVVFYSDNGKPQDIFKTLAEHNVNYIRVRVWNNPYDNSGNSYGGGNCDVNNAAKIGARASSYGMKLLVDFHYSDFWADPDKQRPPKEWENFSFDDKKKAIKEFTISSLNTIRNAGADIGMVQIGNETNNVFCGETGMDTISDLFNSGCEAVREFDSDILTALHFANPSLGYYDWYAQILNKHNVDYDVFATSYYPYWHGSAQNMGNTMKNIAEKYNKYVLVAETAYPYTDNDGDNFGNAVSSTSDGCNFNYPISVQGQADSLSDVFKAVASIGNKGLGVFYWEPAWIGNYNSNYDANKKNWEQFGSGWTTSFAKEYDKNITDAGGSSYDNQALFDFSGKPLESLDVFQHILPSSDSFKENFINNPDFEFDKKITDNPVGWSISHNSSEASSAKFLVNSEDAYSGDYCLHWYSNQDILCNASTSFSALEDASYSFGISVYGENAEYTITAKVNGVIIQSVKEQLNGYGNWHNPVIKNIPAKKNQVISISIEVKNQNSRLETYGSIDNAYMNISGEYNPLPISGDVNGDDMLSANDLQIMKKVLLSDYKDTIPDTADAYKDNKINAFDCVMLKKHLLSK